MKVAFKNKTPYKAKPFMYLTCFALIFLSSSTLHARQLKQALPNTTNQPCNNQCPSLTDSRAICSSMNQTETLFVRNVLINNCRDVILSRNSTQCCQLRDNYSELWPLFTACACSDWIDGLSSFVDGSQVVLQCNCPPPHTPSVPQQGITTPQPSSSQQATTIVVQPSSSSLTNLGTTTSPTSSTTTSTGSNTSPEIAAATMQAVYSAVRFSNDNRYSTTGGGSGSTTMSGSTSTVSQGSSNNGNTNG